MTASPKTSSPARRAAQVPPTTRLGILPKWLIIGSRRRGGVAVMGVALAAVRGALGVGHVLAEQLVGRGPQQQMAGEVAVQQRDHVAARPQRHRHAHRRGLVAGADRHGALRIALLEQLQQPLFHAARKEHQRIGRRVELGLRKPLRETARSRRRGRCAGVDPLRRMAARVDSTRMPAANVGRPSVPADHRRAGLLNVQLRSQWQSPF